MQVQNTDRVIGQSRPHRSLALPPFTRVVALTDLVILLIASPILETHVPSSLQHCGESIMTICVDSTTRRGAVASADFTT
jgi:hypothetical protein